MIQLEHISKRYVGPSGTVDALKDVSVHVEKGGRRWLFDR